MKTFDWNDDKNAWLWQERGISFEQIVFWIVNGGLLDVIEHPNKRRYANQRIFCCKR